MCDIELQTQDKTVGKLADPNPKLGFQNPQLLSRF